VSTNADHIIHKFKTISKLHTQIMHYDKPLNEFYVQVYKYSKQQREQQFNQSVLR